MEEGQKPFFQQVLVGPTNLTLIISLAAAITERGLYLGVWNEAALRRSDEAPRDLSCTSRATFFRCFSGTHGTADRMLLPRPRWGGQYVALLVDAECNTVESSPSFEVGVLSTHLPITWQPSNDTACGEASGMAMCDSVLVVSTDVGEPGDFVTIVPMSSGEAVVERLVSRNFMVESISRRQILTAHAPTTLELVHLVQASTMAQHLLDG